MSKTCSSDGRKEMFRKFVEKPQTAANVKYRQAVGKY
jgi:hypothetical protein